MNEEGSMARVMMSHHVIKTKVINNDSLVQTKKLNFSKTFFLKEFKRRKKEERRNCI